LDLDIDFLKYLVANGSILEASLALAILDNITGGKVTEFFEKHAPVSRVQIPAGAKVKRRC
jgi:hypothetical protein